MEKVYLLKNNESILGTFKTEEGARRRQDKIMMDLLQDGAKELIFVDQGLAYTREDFIYLHEGTFNILSVSIRKK